MTFIESIITCYKKAFTIKGRASRSEFWWFALYFFCAYILTAWLLDLLILPPISYNFFKDLSEVSFVIYDASNIAAMIAIFLFLVLPYITCSIRRLHDTGRSGWYWLIGFIPFVGGLIRFLMLIDKSDGDNEYGPDPTGESFYYEEYHPE